MAEIESSVGPPDPAVGTANDDAKPEEAVTDPVREPTVPDRTDTVPDRADDETPDEGALAGDLDEDDADDGESTGSTEAPTGETAGPATGGGTSLFDPADYDKPGLQIPKIDGLSIDRIGIDFGGGVMLDRSEPADVALYNRIHGERTIELWVEAKWGGVGAKPATNRDGDLDVIVGKKSLRVESIRIVDPEQLGQLEGLELVREAARRAAGRGVPHDQIESAIVNALAEID